MVTVTAVMTMMGSCSPVLFKPVLIVIVMMDLTQLRSQPLYGIVNRLDIVIVVL